MIVIHIKDPFLLLVDESQDFTEAELKILRNFKPYRGLISWDEKQQIITTFSHKSFIKNTFENAKEIALTESYRNTKEIYDCAKPFQDRIITKESHEINMVKPIIENRKPILTKIDLPNFLGLINSEQIEEESTTTLLIFTDEDDEKYFEQNAVNYLRKGYETISFNNVKGIESSNTIIVYPEKLIGSNKCDNYRRLYTAITRSRYNLLLLTKSINKLFHRISIKEFEHTLDKIDDPLKAYKTFKQSRRMLIDYSEAFRIKMKKGREYIRKYKNKKDAKLLVNLLESFGEINAYDTAINILMDNSLELEAALIAFSLDTRVDNTEILRNALETITSKYEDLAMLLKKSSSPSSISRDILDEILSYRE